MVERIIEDLDNINLSVVVYEVIIVDSNPREWRVEIDTTKMYIWTKRCSLALKKSILGRVGT